MCEGLRNQKARNHVPFQEYSLSREEGESRLASEGNKDI
jgi:hypothetical protein